MLSHSPSQIYTLLQSYPLFTAIPETQLLSQIALFKQEIPLGNTDGLVSAKEWSSDLSLFSFFGLPNFNTTESQLAYKQIINMSYLKQALAASKPKTGSTSKTGSTGKKKG
jgi:hypothetical protein